jgi:hypothetical protein
LLEVAIRKVDAMRRISQASRNDKAGLIAAVASAAVTLLTGLACVGPFAAILLGVGGLGWLTRYVHLRVPASVLTLALLGFAFYMLRAPRKQACPATPRRARLARALLWVSAVLAVAINLFEYVIFQHL